METNTELQNAINILGALIAQIQNNLNNSEDNKYIRLQRKMLDIYKDLLDELKGVGDDDKLEELQPYKEQEIMNIRPNQIKNNSAFIDLSNAEYNDVEVIELLCLDKYDIEQDGTKLVLVRKKPQYPKTYDECCMVLQDACMTHKGGYKGGLMQTFQQLLICRDAYWKIAGKEHGLGIPWEPDWRDNSKPKYVILSQEGEIILRSEVFIRTCILAFPTIEMRDAFYENFKEPIEECKDLL